MPFLILATLAATPGGLFAQEAGASDASSAKSVFTKGFPRLIKFRSDFEENRAETYDAWEPTQANRDVQIKKWLAEEVSRPDYALGYAGRFARRHPEVLTLLHLNGRARNPDWIESRRRYFPGHWLYQPGSQLTADVGPLDTQLAVDDPGVFRAWVSKPDDRRQKRGRLVIVPLSEDGSKRWTEAEFAIIEDVEEPRVPRVVWVHTDGIRPSEGLWQDHPQSNARKEIADATELFGFFGATGHSLNTFYYRNAGAPDGSTSARLTVEIEESTPARIRRISLHNATMALARELERGVVLVNPGYEPMEFDLVELFGPGKQYRRLPRDKNDDGQAIVDPRQVVVPPLDGLFLMKD